MLGLGTGRSAYSRWLASGVAALAAAVVLGLATSQAAPAEVTGGYLDWGVKASFRSYVEGNIAHGAISVSGGASKNNDGSFRFPVDDGSYETGDGEISFDGSVRFIGHNYGNGNLLDLTLDNIRLEISGSTATIVADITSREGEINVNAPLEPLEKHSNVDLARLTLGTPTTSTNSVRWQNASASLMSEGAQRFAGFYSAGTALDPASITLNLQAAAATSTPRPAATATAAAAASTATPQSAAGAAATSTSEPLSTWLPAPVATALANGAGAQAPSVAVANAAAPATTRSSITSPIVGDGGLLPGRYPDAPVD